MPQPNILILMCDQMQGRVLAPESPCATPHFDRLASRGVRFARGYTPNAICSPARASLMTGCLPHTHGVLQVNHCMKEYHGDCQPLAHWAQRLEAAGYHTGYFGKWHVERSNELQRFGWRVDGHHGSAYWRENAGPIPKPTFRLRSDIHTDGWDDALLYGVVDTPPSERSLGRTAALASEFIAASDGPWCCFVSVNEPHDPYVCGAEAFARYDPAALPVPANWDDDLSDRPGLYRKSARVFAGLSQDEKRTAAACYYALCSEIDEVYGRLIEQAGEDALVILLSDHGELLGAHGLYQKNVGAFEENYGIPMLWAGPGIAAGQVCQGRLGLQDVGETLLEYLELPPLATGESRSFARLLREPEALFLDDTFGYAEYYGTRHWWSQRVIWLGDWKLVWNSFDVDELYNLAEDPGELRNRIDDPAAQPMLRQMMARAWRLIADTDDHPLGRLGYASLRLAPCGPNQAGD